MVLLLDKAGGLISRGNIPTPPGGSGVECLADPACVGEGLPNCSLGKKNNTFDHLGETDSELKIMAFVEKNTKELDSNSQTCPTGRRGWLLLTYQLLMGPLQKTCL
jgi:hypothetical protein